MMVWDFLIMTFVLWMIGVVADEQEDRIMHYVFNWLAFGFLIMFVVRIVPQLWQYASSL